MKFKRHLKYRLFKLIFRNYTKFLQILYKHKLNSNLIELIKKEVEIKTVYDIGAHRGDFSNFLSKTSLKGKDFYLFEANEKNEKYLNKFDFKYFIDVLSDRKKEVKFYSKSLGGDSYFREQTDIYDDFDAKTKITNTLDNIVEQNNLPFPNFIKIDTQGSEIDILKGAKKVISNCKLIYLECPIIEYNLGSPNLDQYIKYLDSIDFIPYDICEVHYIDKMLVQIDILFIKKSIFNKIYPGKKNLNILN
jgi:FkbM family methyltransferase